MHIAFLEMVIDPVCSLVFEAETEEDDLMRRRPRDPDEPLFSWGMIGWGVFQGALAFALVAAIYVMALRQDMPVDEVRALTFFSLVISFVALIFVNRSSGASLFQAFLRPNRALAITLPAVAAMLAATLLWPTARRPVPLRTAPCGRSLADVAAGVCGPRHAGASQMDVEPREHEKKDRRDDSSRLARLNCSAILSPNASSSPC